MSRANDDLAPAGAADTIGEPVPQMQQAPVDSVVNPDAAKGERDSAVSVDQVNTTVEQVDATGTKGRIKDHEYKPGVSSWSAYHPNCTTKEFCTDKDSKTTGKDEKSFGMKRAETVSVDEATRMRLNGETQTMMDHVQKRWKDIDYDTSGDQKWEIDPDLACADRYVWYVTVSWLAIKILIFALPFLLINMLSMLLIWGYAREQKTPTDYMERTCCFWMLFFFVGLIHLPSLVLLFVGLWMDYAVYYMMGFLWTLFTCRWSKCWASHRALDPYRCGPSIVSLGAQADIFVCYAGQTLRHGFVGTAYNVTVMYLIMPWLKYFWNVNPWIYDLEERFVQQISTSMMDMAKMHEYAGEQFVEKGICDGARRIISRGKQFAYVRANEDYWNFVPHYPYPPPHRRWAMGLQAGGSCNTPAKFTLLVHTTHAISDSGGAPDVKCTEQFVLSNSVHTPVYRVMLWYSNPFHFFTGFVEASISTGGDSQPDKYLGGEHPMWLVTAKSPFLSERNSMTGVGMIDSFFDNWLPIFVHECRRLTHLDHQLIVEKKGFKEAVDIATSEADKLYQEVKDQDGLSVPNSKIGRDKYKGKDNLSIQMKQATGETEDGIGIFEKYTEIHHEVLQREYESETEIVRKYVEEQAKDRQEIVAGTKQPNHGLAYEKYSNCLESCCT
jgi:hypothetical protein